MLGRRVDDLLEGDLALDRGVNDRSESENASSVSAIEDFLLKSLKFQVQSVSDCLFSSELKWTCFVQMDKHFSLPRVVIDTKKKFLKSQRE